MEVRVSIQALRLASLRAGVLLALATAACTGNGSTPAEHADVHADSGPAQASRHVLILSIDGMHGVDLDRYVSARPDSNLARLAKTGVRYTHVLTPFPSDSFPGQLAISTGGTPKSTGIYYDRSYDRHLSPPGSDCATQGTTVDFTEASDLDSSREDAGGGLDPKALPRDPSDGCKPVFPHQYLRVNTTFEVVHDAGMRTSWFDKHASYEVLQGPSGHGIDDAWNPEVAAKGNKSAEGVLAYDDRKVAALLNLMAGKDHTGQQSVAVPALFGMDFQGVSVAQKTVGGYVDASGTPSAGLLTAFDRTDASLGKILDTLKTSGLWDSTTVFVTAIHGQSPIDPKLARSVSPGKLSAAVEAVQSGLLAHLTADTVALLWLTDAAKTTAVAQALQAQADALGIANVMTPQQIQARFASPLVDSRAPDVIATVQLGVIYADKPKGGEHGGNSDDDRRVFLLAAGGGISPAVVDSTVETRQIAPTVLQRLGLDPRLLQAVTLEKTEVLPALPPSK